MLRFGLRKVNYEGRVLGLDELPEVEVFNGVTKDRVSARAFFDSKKAEYRDNFDKLRIGLKRAELMQSAVDDLIQVKKDAYVVEAIRGMSDEEKTRRIVGRNLEILNE